MVHVDDPSGEKPPDGTKRGDPVGFSGVDTAALITLATIWGFTFLFIDVAVRAMAPAWVVVGRTATGGLALLLVTAVRRVPLPRCRRQWGHLAIVAVPGNVLPWTMVAWAQQSIPSGLTAVLYSLMPLTTLVIASVVGLERMTRARVGGLLVAVIGTTLVVMGDLGSFERLAAVAAVLGAIALLACGAVYTKRFLSGRLHPIATATGQVVLACAGSTVIALLFAPIPSASDVTPSVLGAVVGLGALGTGIAFVLYYQLIARVGATNASTVSYLIPVIGVVAGWLVLGERIGGGLVAGGALIVLGIWLGQRTTTRRAPNDETCTDA